MDNLYNKTQLQTFVADLNEEKALDSVRRMIDAGEDPLVIMEKCQEGLHEVGVRYEKRIYFISALIMGGEIMSQISDLIRPSLTSTLIGNDKGLILLGTVEGDIHFLGKDLFKVMAQCHGFSVQDLGVDVSPSDFFNSFNTLKPDIVGMSCLLHIGYDKIKETIAMIKDSQPDPKAGPVFIAGGTMDQTICEYIGADFYTNDAMEGVRICQKVMKGKNR